MSPIPFTYKSNATVLVMGVGLMGQHMASNVLNWLDVKKLVIADHAKAILVGTDKTRLTDFAASVSASQKGSADVIAETVDVTSEEQVRSLLERHGKVDYLMHTAGIAPSPLTPPEQLTKDAIMGAYEVNLWGAHNVIKQGVNSGNLHNARGVIILSTAAKVGAEGRSSSAYEESKGGLLNLVTLQSPPLRRGIRPGAQWASTLAATRADGRAAPDQCWPPESSRGFDADGRPDRAEAHFRCDHVFLGRRMLVCGRSADDRWRLYQAQADLRSAAWDVVIPLAVLAQRYLLFQR